MKHRFAPVAIAAVLALGLAACAPQTAPPTGGSTAEGNITFWTGSSGTSLEILKETIADFEADHDGVTVELVELADADLKQKVQAGLVSGDLPDVFQWYGGTFMGPLVEAGVVHPLNDYFAEAGDWQDGLNDSWADNFTFDGKTYGVPLDSSIVTLYYNTELLAQAGLEGAPESWEEMLDYAEKLKAAGIQPFTVDGQDGYPLQQWFTYLAMRIGGVDLIHDAVAGDVEWTDPAFVEAAEQLEGLIKAGGFQPGFLGEGYVPNQTNFTEGRAAMMVFGSWMLGAFEPEFREKVGVAPFPTVDGGVGEATELQGGPNATLAISEKSSNKDLAWELITRITSLETATERAVRGLSFVPNRVEVTEAETNPQYYALVETIQGATGWNLFWNEVLVPEDNTEFTNLLNSMAAGQITGEQMMQQFAEYMASR